MKCAAHTASVAITSFNLIFCIIQIYLILLPCLWLLPYKTICSQNYYTIIRMKCRLKWRNKVNQIENVIRFITHSFLHSNTVSSSLVCGKKSILYTLMCTAAARKHGHDMKLKFIQTQLHQNIKILLNHKNLFVYLSYRMRSCCSEMDGWVDGYFIHPQGTCTATGKAVTPRGARSLKSAAPSSGKNAFWLSV